MKRTNIMLTDEQCKVLEAQAKKEKRTLEGMVKEAIDLILIKNDPVDRKKVLALDAYSEGFISLGKLAEVLGMDIINTREYLIQKGIAIKTQDHDECIKDAINA